MQVVQALESLNLWLNKYLGMKIMLLVEVYRVNKEHGLEDFLRYDCNWRKMTRVKTRQSPQPEECKICGNVMIWKCGVLS